jgi:hypothetical protein
MEPLLKLNVIIDRLDWVISGVGDGVVWAGITPYLHPLMSRQPLCGVGIVSQSVFDSYLIKVFLSLGPFCFVPRLLTHLSPRERHDS